MVTANVQAIGLGRIVVNSALNQPLDAEISIASIEGNVLESLEITLATDSDFRRANISIEPVVKLLQFNVINGETGPWIHVTTDRSVRTPFLHFLAAIQWSGGRIIREYTALLDPPGYDTVAGQSVTLPRATDRRVLLPGDTYEPVRSGETLMGIATNIDVDKSVTIYQRMFALMHINSEAFIRGNMNLLREGTTLIIPSVEMMAGISRILAREEYTRQLSEWIDYHQGIAQGKSQSGERLWVSLIPGDEKVVVKEVEKTIIKEVPVEKVVVKEIEKTTVKEIPIDTAKAGQDSKRESADATTTATTTGGYVLRIVQPDPTVPPATEVKDTDTVPVPADKPLIDPELENIKHRLTLTEENLASTELENEKLLRQIALLAEQIDKSARLIALQDEALALAQQQAILRTQQTGATPSVGSADTSATPGVPDATVDSSPTSNDQAADSDDQTTVAATSDIGSAASQSSSDQNASTSSGVKEKSTSEQVSDSSKSVVVTSSGAVEDGENKEAGSPASATQLQSGQQKSSGVTTTAVSVDSSDRGSPGSVMAIIRSLATIDGLNRLYQKDEQLVAMLGAAIILMLLLALLVIRRKRSIGPDDDTPSGTIPIVVPAVTSKRDDENSAQQSAGASQRDDSNGSSEQSEIPKKSDDTSTEQGKATDPISEAGIYLTYGHHDQAEQVLTSAILSEPTRTDLKLKLLEVYKAQGNLEKFEQTAGQLSTSLPLDSSEWLSVVQMGRALSSNSSLFTATPLREPDAGSEIASDSVVLTEEIGIDLELEEPGVEMVTPAISSPPDAQPDVTPRSSSTDLKLSEEPVQPPVEETVYGPGISDSDESTEDPDSTDSMDVGTRLDLARAYIEMGDNSAAKNMLNEVVQHGDSDQKASAEAMLMTLDNK